MLLADLAPPHEPRYTLKLYTHPKVHVSKFRITRLRPEKKNFSIIHFQLCTFSGSICNFGKCDFTQVLYKKNMLFRENIICIHMQLQHFFFRIIIAEQSSSRCGYTCKILLLDRQLRTIRRPKIFLFWDFPHK